MYDDFKCYSGGEALYSHNEEVERCGYLPAVKYPSWYLCPSGKSSVDVNDCDETM